MTMTFYMVCDVAVPIAVRLTFAGFNTRSSYTYTSWKTVQNSDMAVRNKYLRMLLRSSKNSSD